MMTAAKHSRKHSCSNIFGIKEDKSWTLTFGGYATDTCVLMMCDTAHSTAHLTSSKSTGRLQSSASAACEMGTGKDVENIIRAMRMTNVTRDAPAHYKDSAICCSS